MRVHVRAPGDGEPLRHIWGDHRMIIVIIVLHLIAAADLMCEYQVLVCVAEGFKILAQELMC